MDLTQSILSYGLRSTATPTSTNVFNDVEVGVAQTQDRFPDADVIYSLRAVMAGSASTLTIAQGTGACTSTAWVAGTQQVETATAAGTITASGNASVTVTSLMPGSPLTVSVPVITGDTAAVWAGKVRTALAADATIAARFAVGGTATAISLTRLPATVGGLPIRAANETALNIALANGTCTGITAASTSANTTPGVATSGVTLYDGDGKDFEGNVLPAMPLLYATMLILTDGDINYEDTSNATVNMGIGKYLMSWDIGQDTGGEYFNFTGPVIAPEATQFTFTVLGRS